MIINKKNSNNKNIKIKVSAAIAMDYGHRLQKYEVLHEEYYND
jgi:hypothetical protein